MIRLPQALAARISREARSSYPAEACGFLVGTSTGTEVTVRRVMVAENRAARPDRFLIDARDVFEALQSARGSGAELIGVYHSHPDGSADPSPTDLRDAWGDWLHLIVSCPAGVPGEVKCWRRDAAAFAPVEIRGEER
jgi:proteasome lid subunit RPN8/RPN11